VIKEMGYFVELALRPSQQYFQKLMLWQLWQVL
jgi:hypothetical protein